MGSWLAPLASLYGAAAMRRRRRYVADPARRHRACRPVISVGNISVGGSGKTPTAAALARLLREHGERPSILSRGYRRKRAADGVTIVSDGRRIRAALDAAGDEPLMLARALPDVPVLVGDHRYVAARFAEEKLGVTVHLLDDGFQHLELARDVDLVIVRPEDLQDAVLPAGRLREPLAAVAMADAVIVPTSDEATAQQVARAVGVSTWFRLRRQIGAPWWFTADDGAIGPGTRVFGVAGIARPDLFFDDLSGAGWDLAGTMAFRDHHPFSSGDVRRIESAAGAAGAVVVTTEKDAVRLEGCGFGRVPVAVLPIAVTIEPAAAFTAWLAGRLATARWRRQVAGVEPGPPASALRRELAAPPS